MPNPASRAEEIFESFSALWTSVDGTHLMYATFNDSRVGMMTFPWFTSNTVIAASGEGNRELFPVSKTIRYPTPGSVNPEVSLWVMDISNVSNIRKWEVIRPAALEGQ